jgi:dipeptidyl aminopeptidase/acylaminoacyl peptidase
VSNNNDGGEDTVYWTELRPKEGGRYALCQYAPSNAHKNERNAIDISPNDSNVRTRVHEYGGGAVILGGGGDDGAIFYSEFKTQRLHKLIVVVGKDDEVTIHDKPITPSDSPYCYADGVYDGKNGKIYCIREDHTHPAPKDVKNEIVSVSTTEGETDQMVWATGNDFFAAPRMSPDGTKLAYITWNHPNMPWDATQLKVISLDKTSKDADTSTHPVLAGTDNDTSVLQPLWHPLTGDLYYISDETGFYNIYRAKLSSSDDGNSKSINVLPLEFDFGGSAPGWALGQQGFTFLQDGRLVATYTKQGKSVLVVANVMDNSEGPATDIQEYGMDQHGLPRQFGGVVAGSNGNLYFLGGSPSTPTSVYKWNLNQSEQPAQILACSSNVSFPDTVISTPQQITFPTTYNGKNDVAYGYYYPPTNHQFTCTTEPAPPLLVKAHGGPTACTSTTFNARIQYWTSRGFAILDVDYGGSTGYGRDYRRRLRQSWGIVDIEDVCAGAMYLVKQGKADFNRLCIDGGSAGGYTTLGALAFKDVFKAGCSLYGVGDLTALAQDTHKFESRYLDGLVGPYPQDEEIYRTRSPIHNVDSLSCPILLLQGAEDKIVPPNQAETMHQTLLQKGIPTCLKIYQGEQHGFRKAENIRDALDSELAFYGRVFGFQPHNGIKLEIDNM